MPELFSSRVLPVGSKLLIATLKYLSGRVQQSLAAHLPLSSLHSELRGFAAEALHNKPHDDYERLFAQFIASVTGSGSITKRMRAIVKERQTNATQV